MTTVDHRGVAVVAGPHPQPWHYDGPPPPVAYRREQEVWVWIHGHNGWLAGQVEIVFDHAVQVRYELPGGGGATDRFRPEFVRPVGGVSR